MPQGRSLPKTPNVRLRLITLGGAVLVVACTHEPEPVLLPPLWPIAKADSSY